MSSNDWYDVALPGLEPPPAKPTRPMSEADEERANRLKYTRFKSARSVHCMDCIDELDAGTRQHLFQAAWRRTHNGTEVLLCQFHKLERAAEDGYGQ